MKLSKFLAAIGQDCAQEADVQAISNDNRQLDKCTWWLAARGVHGHALDYYRPAQDCAGIFYEPPYDNPPLHAIAVPDLAQKIGVLADAFYDYPSRQMRLIGVTGTDGKSSLVHFLAQALDAAMIGTIGYGHLAALQKASHTTPDALRVQQLLRQFADEGRQCTAMEVSSHALVQGRVAAVRFDTAVFSNLSRDHLDYHQDMEDYFLAKAQLFARPIRHALINTDDAYGRRLIEEGRIHPQAEIWSLSAEGRPLSAAHHQLSAQDVRLNAEGLAFTLHYKGQSQAVQSRLLARFNVANLLNVAACLLSGDQDLAQTAVVLARLQGVPGRVEKIDLGEGRAAIVDYAHTAGAIESVLQGIRPHVQGKLSLIFGCGGDRDAGKRPLMAAAAERFADTVIVTDDNPRSEDPQAIIADIMQGFEAPEKVQIIQPREAAIRAALEQLQAGDTLLIAGKGHENYQIIGTSVYEYSDQTVIRAWKTK